MKTSKRLLIIVAGFIILLLIVSLFILRRDIRTLMEKQAFIEYKLIQVKNFMSIDFSSNWIAQIKQGKDCKVELAIGEGSDQQPKLENKNEMLILSMDSVHTIENASRMHVRVTAPVLHIIKAEGNTRIMMKNFWSDSLTVMLTDSSTFSGKNNDFTQINFKAFENE